MHLQSPPAAHDKLIYCVVGSVLDVVVDLRTSSPTTGRVFACELSGANRDMLFIPAGFAHGFLSLEDNSVLVYQTSSVHAPAHDVGILWDSIDFTWPVVNPIISTRDRQLPPLAHFSSPF
jgi:dTDP-4-dehydrorhamnose 3,5-epimerase